MSKSMITTYGLDGDNSRIDGIETPDECPRCKRSIEAVNIALTQTTRNAFTVTYLCKGCKQNFLTDYIVFRNRDMRQEVRLKESYPKEFQERHFDQQLIEMSPEFSNIYNQALIAEVSGLNQIAGMGYRKSLEFLIKDYSCFLVPEDEDKIKSSTFSLSKCIDNYITAENLKDLTRLTSWLGNDETHYSRVHEDKDIEDLKIYLDSAVYFIMHDLVAKKARVIVNT